MAFLWIALYGMTYIVSEAIARQIGTMSWITPAAMLLYVGMLLLWLHKRGFFPLFDLRRPSISGWKPWLCLLPAFLLPAWNLWAVQQWQATWYWGVLLISGAVAEELFFRGFLQNQLVSRYKSWGLIITSGCFALLHCVNFLNTGDADALVLQVLCAFACGIYYSALRVRFQSLFPCIAAHLAVNLTGMGQWTGKMKNTFLWLCIIIYAGYGLWLCRANSKRKKENKT